MFVCLLRFKCYAFLQITVCVLYFYYTFKGITGVQAVCLASLLELNTVLAHMYFKHTLEDAIMLAFSSNYEAIATRCAIACFCGVYIEQSHIMSLSIRLDSYNCATVKFHTK